MTKSEFQSFLSVFGHDLQRITDSKGIEYANADDQLANFKRLSDRLGSTPEKVLMVYLTKHLDSIEHAVRTGKVLSEPLRSRCLDAVLYLVLLAALDDERRPKPAADPNDASDAEGYTVHVPHPYPTVPPLVTR